MSYGQSLTSPTAWTLTGAITVVYAVDERLVVVVRDRYDSTTYAPPLYPAVSNVGTYTPPAPVAHSETLWEQRRRWSREAHAEMCRRGRIRRPHSRAPRRRTHQQPRLRGIR